MPLRFFTIDELSGDVVSSPFYCIPERQTNQFLDTLNEASKTAAGKLGFTLEGVLRQYMILKGQVRDVASFSMLESEWKDRVKAHLELKLAK